MKKLFFSVDFSNKNFASKIAYSPGPSFKNIKCDIFYVKATTAQFNFSAISAPKVRVNSAVVALKSLKNRFGTGPGKVTYKCPHCNSHARNDKPFPMFRFLATQLYIFFV